MPKTTPSIIHVPAMNYLAVKGQGDPNDDDGEYYQSIELLYTIAYTLKMSYKTTYQIKGVFQYVVPPLEGFWWQKGIKGVDYSRKSDFEFISLIRLPDFIRYEDYQWGFRRSQTKKRKRFSKVEWLRYDEGLCVQCMHIGPYDQEPQTVSKMHTWLEKAGISP